MVMFREDDLRMKKKPGKIRKWLTRIILTCVIVFFGVSMMLSVMSGLGGPREPLRKGIEEYLRELTGFDAKIGAFTDMQFYPDFKVDAGDIVLSAKDGAEVAHIGRIAFSKRFFDQLLSRNRFETLTVRNVRSNAGIFTGRKFTIEKIDLVEEGLDGKPALTAEGRYGEEPVKLSLQMDAETGIGGRHFYALRDKRVFAGKIGRLEAEGSALREGLREVNVDLKKIANDGDSFSGGLKLSYAHSETRLSGAILAGKSRCEPDLVLNREKTAGTLKFTVAEAEDLASFGRLIDTVSSYLLKDKSALKLTCVAAGDMADDKRVKEALAKLHFCGAALPVTP
jgi:hypothetical protein